MAGGGALVEPEHPFRQAAWQRRRHRGSRIQDWTRLPQRPRPFAHSVLRSWQPEAARGARYCWLRPPRRTTH